MQNFIAQSMRKMGLATSNKVTPASPNSGGVTTAGNAPLSHMEVEGKYAYSTLSYPLDLQSRSDLGHYMMFYINVPNNTEHNQKSDKARADLSVQKEWESKGGKKLTSKENAKLALLQNERGHSSGKGKTVNYDQTGKTWKAGETDKVLHREQKASTFPKMTKRTSDAITLYMPNTGITSQHTPQWTAPEMGGTVGEGVAAGVAAAGMGGNAWGSINSFLEQAATKVEKMAVGMASGLAGGDLEATKDKLQNQAENKFIETFFKGVELRKFQFSWQFRPKSPEEAYAVYKIIETFKFHSLPEFPAGKQQGRYFTVPATFDIFYMYRGDENQWINKIATCVCGGVNINYSPQQWQTFRPLEEKGWPQGAPPTEIDMQLEFMESKIITKEDVLEGF
tara:strand:- start:47 stop:1228 length:1182 start_codon:yes stop_codon:yes gene_type:complete